MVSQPTAESYDQIPYPSLTYAQTHPDRLATMGWLLGMKPAPVENCRYLDIGCAVGGNIIPMAYGLPGSEFVGIDYSSRQIEIGRQNVAQFGLTNILLEQVDIMEFPADLGEFDYIVTHGIYSWVPQEVRDGLLNLIRQHLAPQGIAYVSYNVYPGWHMLSIVRDMMRYHIRDVNEPRERVAQAREMLAFLTDAIPADASALGSFLDTYSGSLANKLAEGEAGGDALLLHDELEEINEPVYFYQFAEHSRRHNLQYLSEVELAKVMPSRFPPDVVKRLTEMARRPIDMEQYLDFLRNRTFRQTLLCRQEVTINRTLKPGVVRSFQLSSRARPSSEDVNIADVQVEKFSGPDGAVFATEHPVSKAAMVLLAQNSPKSIPFDQLLAEAAGLAGLGSEADMEAEALTLGANILRAYSYSSTLVELHVYLPEFVTTPGSRPMTSPVARWQAGRGIKVTNMRHERVELNDMACLLLGHLDGQHTRDDLLQDLMALHNKGVLVLSEKRLETEETETIPDLLSHTIDDNLRFFGRAALLLA